MERWQLRARMELQLTRLPVLLRLNSVRHLRLVPVGQLRGHTLVQWAIISAAPSIWANSGNHPIRLVTPRHRVWDTM